jgi:hypothetical protein
VMIFPRKSRCLFMPCCVLTVLAIGFPCFAQESAEPPARVPQQIILPHKIVSGAPATLAVADASGQLVPNVVVELSSGQKIMTDATGRGSFNAPKIAGILAAQIPAQNVIAFTFVLAPQVIPPVGPARADSVRILSYPRFLAKTDKFMIDGTEFRGDADTNRVTIGDQQCFVLAASPVSLVAFPGARVPAGAGNLSVTIAGRDPASVPVTVVQIEVSASAEATDIGAKGTVSVHVRGAAEPLTVEIVNKSPDVVQLPQGAVQQLRTSGGENNIAQAAMKSLKPGDYVVTAHLISTVSGQPDLESARQELVAARLAATGKWAGRVDGVLKRFDKKPPNPSKILVDLALMQRDMPPGQLELLMDMATHDLVRN